MPPAAQLAVGDGRVVRLGQRLRQPNWQERKLASADGYCCAQCGKLEPPGRQHDCTIRPFRTFGHVAGVNEHYRSGQPVENLMLFAARHHRLESGVRASAAGWTASPTHQSRPASPHVRRLLSVADRHG
ncbi:MAG: hypothetical protein R2838_03305 [Caldilineaceae bacterium]